MRHTFAPLTVLLLLCHGVTLAQTTATAGAQTAPASRLELFHAPASANRNALHRQRTTLSVDASAGWAPTGILVSSDDTILTTASGTVQLAGHTLTADGMLRGWRDMLRHFPVDGANAGALVARIGSNAASLPFAVGTESTHTATADGELYLRVNSSAELPATGSLRVKLSIVPPVQSIRTRTVSPAAVSRTATAVSRTGTAVSGTAVAMSVPAADTGDAGPLSAFTPTLLHSMDALPRRVADRDGTPGDALNFALLGTEADVRSALARSGWFEVDADASAAVVHGLLNTLEHRPYVQVPMSTLYLFGRPQDLGFARAAAISVASERHHLRCWQTTLTANGTPLWVGAATHDVGLARDERSGHITHRIAPEIDLERDFLRDSFLSSGSAAAAAYFTPLNPVRSAHTATGGAFVSDGRILLLALH